MLIRILAWPPLITGEGLRQRACRTWARLTGGFLVLCLCTFGGACGDDNEGARGGSIAYHLTSGSTLLASPPPAAASSPARTYAEPVTGTFPVLAAPSPFNEPGILYTVSNFAASGALFSVESDNLQILASVANDGVLTATMDATVNGQHVFFCGEGPDEGNNVFQALQLCGALSVGGTCETIRKGFSPGYILTIFAAPLN